MSLETTANISVGISWQQIDTQGLNRLSDIGNVNANVTLLQGSGDEQVNTIWHDVITLPSGSSQTISFSNLTRTILSSTVNVSFSNVKSIIIKNNSEDVGANITVSAETSSGLWDLFGGNSGDDLTVYPQCAHSFSRIIDGWTVSNKVIQINDISNSGCEVEISIVGCS